MDGLIVLSGQMESADASRVLSQALARETDADAQARLAAAAALLEPSNAARIAQTQYEVLARKTPRGMGQAPLPSLASIADRLEPTEAGRICAELSQKFAVAMEKETNAVSRASLASLIESIANGPRTDISRKIWEPAIQTLTNAFEKEKDDNAQSDLAWALGPLADRLGTDEAARICQPGAESLSKALKKETKNLDERGFSLVKGLGAMMLRLPRDQAIQAIRLLATVAEETRGGMQSRTVDFYNLIGSLDPGDATRVARLLAAALEKEKDANIRWWLAAGLCLLGEKMDPGEIAHICGPVAKDMADAVVTKKASGGLEYSGYLVDGFMVVATKLGTGHTNEAAKALAAGMERETEANACSRLAQALAAAAGRMEPAQAAGVCGQAANLLAAKLERETDAIARNTVAQALASVGGRMEPTQAAQVCGQAAKTLAEAFGRETDADARSSLASALSGVAGRMDPAEDTRIVIAALERETNANVLTTLAGILTEVAGRMEPAGATQVCSAVIRIVLRERSAEPLDRGTRNAIDGIVAMLLPQVDRGAAHLCVHKLSMLMFAEADVNNADPTVINRGRMGGYGAMMGGYAQMMGMPGGGYWNNQSPNTILEEASPAQIARRSPMTAIGIVQGSAGLPVLSAITAVAFAAEPYPCRLTTQELVDLLKMPTCFGEARRVVLDHLGNRYGQRFVNHWAFVRFTREQGLDLDFTTPPKRPDPRESVKRMLEILDRSDAR